MESCTPTPGGLGEFTFGGVSLEHCVPEKNPFRSESKSSDILPTNTNYPQPKWTGRGRMNARRWRNSPSPSLRNTLTGEFPKEAYLDMGFNKAEIAEIRELRKEKARSAGSAMFRSLFKKAMHSTSVNNLHQCGVFSEDLKANLEQ